MKKFLKWPSLRRLASRYSKKRRRESRDWFERNYEHINRLFTAPQMRNFVFEPFGQLWASTDQSTPGKVKATITQIAVANALLAGLPGKMGVGVFVCMALEAYMAICIARHVGLDIKKTSDIWKYMALGAGIIITIIFVFRHLLGIAYSAFSIIPFVPPIVLAELFVTNFVGVMFWVGFENARSTDKFSVPKGSLKRVSILYRDLLAYQGTALKQTFTVSNITETGQRMWAWLSGNIVSTDEMPRLRGDQFTAAAIAFLIMGNHEAFDGPIGQMFIQSIKDRWPDLAESSNEEIGEFMRNSYDSDQLQGVHSTIKGKLFENMVEAHENSDGDKWASALHEDESFPGSDITFHNDETGESIEVSLKATDSGAYIEEALRRYPDIPIMTTNEVAGDFEDFDNVVASSFSNEDMTRITEDNFSDLVSNLRPVEMGDAVAAAGIGGSSAAVMALYPYLIAYLRKKISKAQLGEAAVKVLPKSGRDLALKLSFATVFGPVYAYYVLAKAAMQLTPKANEEIPSSPTRRLVCVYT